MLDLPPPWPLLGHIKGREHRGEVLQHGEQELAVGQEGKEEWWGDGARRPAQLWGGLEACGEMLESQRISPTGSPAWILIPC